MTYEEVAATRLVNQAVVATTCKTAYDVVKQLGAMQAQDYLAARWAVGLRLPGSTETTIEQAVARAEIVRTWPMRGTLHFVPPEDVRWMLALLGPGVLSRAAGRHRQLGLDEATFHKAAGIFVDALQGGHILTRQELLGLLEDAGLAPENQRGSHMLWWAAHNAIICPGPLAGKQQTFVLLDEWVPQAKSLQLEADTALAGLAERYFSGHGPASLQDFVRWTTLSLGNAKRAFASIASNLIEVKVAGESLWMNKDSQIDSSLVKHQADLLPPFDEYLIGYADRRAALQSEHGQKVVPGNNGIFFGIAVLIGRVVGTWRRTIKKDQVTVTITLFAKLKPHEIKKLEQAAGRYAAFLQKMPLVTFDNINF